MGGKKLLVTSKKDSLIAVIVSSAIIVFHLLFVMGSGLAVGPMQPKIILETYPLYTTTLLVAIVISATLTESNTRGLRYENFIPLLCPIFLLGIFLVGVVEEREYLATDLLIKAFLIDGVSPICLYAVVFFTFHFNYLRKHL